MPRRKDPNAEPKKMGRPLKVIDWSQFDKLCGLQCTLHEIAGYFDCTTDTIESAVKREQGMSFSEYFDRKRGHGKIALRRIQMRLAEKNASMAMFLGVNYLDQTNERRQQTVNVATDDKFIQALTIGAREDWKDDEQVAAASSGRVRLEAVQFTPEEDS